jgi:hypothetical protein
MRRCVLEFPLRATPRVGLALRQFPGWTLAAALVLAGGGMLAAQPRAPRLAGGAGRETGGGQGLWVSTAPLDDGRQLLLVIDPEAKNAAVYHVDPATGSLTLRSTRNITWDLLVPEYNAQEPRPGALKKMLEAGG